MILMHKKINIPVNITDDDYIPNDSDVILNSEETPTTPIQDWGKKDQKLLITSVLIVFTILISIIFFMASNSPTIEELRKDKISKLNEELKIKTSLMNWYKKLYDENTTKVLNLKSCIEKNSQVGVITDC